jgi:hypothetical protein
LFVNGERVPVRVDRDQLSRDFRYLPEWGDSNANTVQLALGARFRDIGFRSGALDELKVFDQQLSLLEMASLFAQATPITSEAKEQLLAHVNETWDPMSLRSHPDGLAMQSELLSLRRKENDLVTQVRQIMAMKSAIKPRVTHILERGAYDAPRDAVVPRPLSRLIARSIPGVESDQPIDRTMLAHWLTSPDHPLTSRVTVNRFWALFFGRGIVASLEDFGSQGMVPTHPELLDWLARDFTRNGWDVKRFCKQVVLSATYRQDSVYRNLEWDGIDPDNRWLARGPRHRLSAEQLRDAALASTGLLVPKIGGPSVMPYQPAGLWEESGTGKSYQQEKGEGLYRRSMYTFWRRTAPPPSMLAFDATSRETCTARRETTTTPLQALVLLNDPQYIEAARAVSETVLLAHPKDRSARWSELALRLIHRPLTPAETSILAREFEEQLDYFQSHGDSAKEFLSIGERAPNPSLDPIELAATTVLAETLICFDEFVMKR